MGKNPQIAVTTPGDSHHSETYIEAWEATRPAA
jgi:hypothetical protein